MTRRWWHGLGGLGAAVAIQLGALGGGVGLAVASPAPWSQGVDAEDVAAAREAYGWAYTLNRMMLPKLAVRAAERSLERWEHPMTRHLLGIALYQDRPAESLAQLWRAMRYGGEGLSAAHVTETRDLAATLFERVAHVLVRSECPGEVRLGERVVLSGPGAWEGVVARDDLLATFGERQGQPCEGPCERLADVWRPLTRLDRVVELTAAREAGTLTLSWRDATEEDRARLQRSLVGFEVEYPSGEALATWPEPCPPPRWQTEALDAELPPEATRLCEGARGDLARVCELYAADLADLARRTAEASAARDAVRWRLGELSGARDVGACLME